MPSSTASCRSSSVRRSRNTWRLAGIAGARASHLEVRVALARSAGNPHAFVVPRPSIRAGTLAIWVVIALGTGLLAGWAANQRWGGPGGGAALEETRGTIVVQ